MWRLAVGCLIVCGLGGCNQLFGIPNVSEGDLSRHVGGQVRGMWDGADGVALHLQADGVDQLLTVATNGSFQFQPTLAVGVSYAVTVATSPARHTCVVDSGSNGVIADAEVTGVVIACTGPATDVLLSGPSGWRFDPAQDAQTFAGSVVAQDVTLTITGAELTQAEVDSAQVDLGKPTPAIALPLGMKTLPIKLTASGGLSKTYQLTFSRGAAVVNQMVYGKASSTQSGDFFGSSIALSGDTLVIGADAENGGSKGINGDPMNKTSPSSGAVYVFVRQGETWTQQAYLKASNTGDNDKFGSAVALSGDTLAVGAPFEASGGDGVNANQDDDSAYGAGATYIFVRSGTTWTQQAYLKASSSDAGDHFGGALALSGNTLAVGASGESSAATGVNGDEANNNLGGSGAVYIYVRAGVFWSKQAYLKASNPSTNDFFGGTVSLDGDTLAVGANSEDSAATGVNGNQNSETAANAGAAYVFVRSGTAWSQQAYLKASNTGANDLFGVYLSLSGSTLAVGAVGEASAATGVGGDQADNTAVGAGAVYIFVRDGTTWSQQAYLKASNTSDSSYFGTVALAGDLLAVGASGEASVAKGVDGDQTSKAAKGAGAVYVFSRDAGVWSQKSYVKASNTDANDSFGRVVGLSSETLVVGAFNEASGDAGINGNQADNSATSAGAMYVFR